MIMLTSRHDNSDYAGLVKGVHKDLRKQIKKGLSFSDVWDNHLLNKAMLSEYAHAMHMLGVQKWSGNDACQDRLSWCAYVCEEYFYKGGLLKSVKKALRRNFYERFHEVKSEQCSYLEKERLNRIILDLTFESCWSFRLANQKLLLLDVGSCYNPFKKFDSLFVPVAIDVAPATTDVINCDFLSVDISVDALAVNDQLGSFRTGYSVVDTSPLASELKNGISSSLLDLDIMCCSRLKIKSFLAESFDVVVFSLLLCYFPTPFERYRCCVRAHQILRINGLLIIITPDSSHQNRNMGMITSWRNCIEAIGFMTFKYTKLLHMHCLAFRKSSNETCFDENNAMRLFIHQDEQRDVDDGDKKVSVQNGHDCVGDDNLKYFHELPSL